jgi:small multidrug resistance pump
MLRPFPTAVALPSYRAVTHTRAPLSRGCGIALPNYWDIRAYNLWIGTYLLLAIAILSETCATVSLKLSNGFTRVVPSIVVAVGYLASFVLLSIVLKRGLPVGVVYAIWSAVGVALVALIGAVFLHETLTLWQLLGLGLIIAGVAVVELGAAR